MTMEVTQEKRTGLKTNVASNEKSSSVAVGNETVQEARKQQDANKKDGLSPEQRRLDNLSKLVEKDEGTARGRKLVTYQIPRGQLEIIKNPVEPNGRFTILLRTKDTASTETLRMVHVTKKGEVQAIGRIIKTAKDKPERESGSFFTWSTKEEVQGEWAAKFADGLISDGLKVINKGVPTSTQKFKVIN
jgi:hypothetical protein